MVRRAVRKLPSEAWRLILAFGLVYVIWGSTYLAIRFAVETLPPLLMAGARNLVAGGILYLWVRARGAPRPTFLHWRTGFAVGTLLLLGGNGGVTWAEQRVPSGLTAVIVAMVPLWMVVFHAFAGGRRETTGLQWAGVLLGLGGVAVLVDPGAREHVDLAGTAALLAATVLWAAGSLYSRRAPLPKPALLAVAIELLGGGVALVLTGLAIGEGPRIDLAAASPKSLLSFAYLVVFGSIVGFTAYIYLLNHTTPARVSTYAYVNPAVAVVLGWAFAREQLTARTALAGAVILAGVVLLTLSGRARPRPPAVATDGPRPNPSASDPA